MISSRFVSFVLLITISMVTFAIKVIPDEIVGPKSAIATKIGCPRKQDIHPCECIEIPKGVKDEIPELETVVFCKVIRNAQVLQNAMKGMQGYIVDFLVMDSCKLPPFPNGLFHNVGIKWMEILNSSIQFTQDLFECANHCW